MIRKSFYIIFLTAVIVLGSCTGHQKLLKSTDNDAKYDAAMDFYEDNDYYKALQLFQQLINFYKGTEKAEKLQYYYAYCYYEQKDFLLASYYFKRFSQNFPRSVFAEEALFLSAYCYYLDSPKSTLDQSNSIQAINELQLFIDIFPDSERVEQASDLIDQLRMKLEKKDFDIANLYFKMGRYAAAIKSYENILKGNPSSPHKEDILFNVLQSNYNYALKSINRKQDERFQSAIDAYNEFKFQFPESEYMKAANSIEASIQKKL